MAKHILLLTDLSADCAAVYAHGVSLAKLTQANLTIAFVEERLEGHFAAEILADYLVELEERIDQRLNEVGQRLEDALLDSPEPSLVVRTRRITGAPGRDLVRQCESLGVDLIVVPQHLGREAKPGPIVGRIAKHIIRHARHPLLVVPYGPASSTHYDRLLVATDFSSDSHIGLSYTTELAETLNAAVVLLHVLKLPTPLTPLPGEPPLFFPVEHTETVRVKLKLELDQNLAAHDGLSLTSEVTINTDAGAGIVDAADEVDADLVIVPSHGRGALRAALLGSTSEHVVKHCDRPVMILPHQFVEQWDPAVAGDVTPMSPV